VWDLVARHHLVDLVATDVEQATNSSNVDHIVVGRWLARGVCGRHVSIRIPIGKQRRKRLCVVALL
jgi:hypothetical protein